MADEDPSSTSERMLRHRERVISAMFDRSTAPPVPIRGRYLKSRCPTGRDRAGPVCVPRSSVAMLLRRGASAIRPSGSVSGFSRSRRENCISGIQCGSAIVNSMSTSSGRDFGIRLPSMALSQLCRCRTRANRVRGGHGCRAFRWPACLQPMISGAPGSPAAVFLHVDNDQQPFSARCRDAACARPLPDRQSILF